jgi:hypothetical protein
VFFVVVYLLDIAAIAVEQRGLILVALVSFRPIHLSQIRPLGRERFRDGVPYRIEPPGDRAIFIAQRFRLPSPAAV